jgi:ATP-dependent Zn protease
VKRKITRELRAIAHHEAGHAVVAWRLGLKFRRVTIKSEGDSLGHVLNVRGPKWLNDVGIISSVRLRLHAERYIVYGMAGQIAEEKFRGRRPKPWAHADDDRSAIVLAMRAIPGSQRTVNAFLHYCFESARDIVDSQWPQVTAVAAALLAQDTLTYEETLEVITPGAKAKLAPKQTE